jgi:formylmethanofuran dehydrogenase subunit E/very-short-patch-repair endonuclease
MAAPGEKGFRWTAEWVKRKGFSIHGNDYNYDNVVDPVRSAKPITIICNRCNKQFQQKLANHIDREQGCSDCNRGERITYEVFIRKATAKHDNAYDYSNIKPEDSISSDHDVSIICRDCEYVFSQNVDCHMNRGQGCPKCAGTLKYTYELFLERVADRPDIELFDYSEIALMTDLTKETKVPIFCNICDWRFMQRINDHVNNKSGCPNCAGLLRYTYQIFIEKATLAHGDKYDYSLIDPEMKIKVHDKVKIKCNVCQYTFDQSIDGHVNKKNGCPKCSKCLRYTYEIFVEKARERHGDMYDYSKAIALESYGYYTKVPIVCCKCTMEFKQIIGAHVTNGQGCPKCIRSKGEIVIETYLRNNSIIYETEYCLESLPRKRFDFVLGIRKILIEFDGAQHFNYCEFFHSDIEEFEERKNVDVIKTIEAIKCGYTIIRIGYNIKNIHEYLNHILSDDYHLYVSCDELYTTHVVAVREILPDVKVKIGYTA